MLFHDVTLNYHTPIISQQGEVVGRLQVCFHKAPMSVHSLKKFFCLILPLNFSRWKSVEYVELSLKTELVKQAQSVQVTVGEMMMVFMEHQLLHAG